MEDKIKGLAAFIAVLLLSDLAVGIAQFSFAGIRLLIGKETSLAKTPLSLQYVAITAQIVFIYHGNLLQGILAAVIGIILGYLRFKTNSLIPAITLHISNNLFSEVINLYTENINNNTLVYAILLVIGIAGVIGFIKLFNNKQNLIIA